MLQNIRGYFFAIYFAISIIVAIIAYHKFKKYTYVTIKSFRGN